MICSPVDHVPLAAHNDAVCRIHQLCTGFIAWDAPCHNIISGLLVDTHCQPHDVAWDAAFMVQVGEEADQGVWLYLLLGL